MHIICQITAAPRAAIGRDRLSTAALAIRSTRSRRCSARIASRCQAPAYQARDDDSAPAPRQFRRQVVDYRTSEAPGTIIIDTPNTYLYLVMPGGKAMRYGIGVGREGFTWAGTQTITRKAEWPDWTPPAEMLQRQPYLPRFMAGGPANPLGARAMYLGLDLPHPRHQRAVHHRRPRLLGLHPHDQRGRDRPLQPRERRHQGGRAADQRRPRAARAARGVY